MEDKLFRLSAGEYVEDGKLRFYVLYPDENHANTSENENSMVLYVESEGYKALYTGDIPFDAEETVLKEMDKLGLDRKIGLLKVPHHGSRFSCSEEFLKEIRPDRTVISAGIGNSYGHPAAELLERLEKAGCEVHVTAEEGEVMIDKKSKKVYTIR